jgi:O-antigen/teichoic acid export membrane protein
VIKKAISSFKSKRKALESLSIYLTTSFLAKSLSFLLLPWFTNYLSPSDFGVINLFSGGITFLTPLISMGVIYNLSIDYYKIKHSENVQKIYHGLVLGFLLMMFISVVVLLFSNYFSSVFKIPLIFIYYLPLLTFFNFLFELLLLVYRLNEKPYSFSLLVILKLTIELGASFYLIKFMNQGVKGRIDGIALSYVLAFFFTIVYLYRQKQIPFKLNRQILKEDIKLGLVGIISQSSIFVLFSADRFIISYFSGNENTGIYSVGATFAFILIVVISACLNYFTPKFYKCLSENNMLAFKKNFRYYIAFIFCACFFIAIITPFVYLKYINPKFHDGLDIFFILLVGILLWAFSNVFLNLMWYYKMKKIIMITSIINIIIHLFLLIIANYFWSYTGCAFAIIISNIIIFFEYFFILNKKFKSIK